MEIYLDPQIRNWVFIPLLLGLLILAKVKQNIQRVLAGGGKKEVEVTSEQAFENKKNATNLLRARRFLANCGLLPRSSFEARLSYFCGADKGVLVSASQQPQESPMSMMANNPMANPEAMAGMLKGNLMMILTMGLQYWGVSHFFSGMLVGKVGFPVPQKFRETLQKGVEVLNIDVKYISSLSLYFLTFFGMNTLLSLVSPSSEGEEEADASAKQAMMGAAAGPGMPGLEGPKKESDSLLEELKLHKHSFLLDNALIDFVESHKQLLNEK